MSTSATAVRGSRTGHPWWVAVFSHVMWITGSLLIALISMTLGDRDFAGQLPFGVIAAVGLVGLLLRLTIPESELWLRSREEQRLGIRTVRADRTRVRDLVRPPFQRPFLVLIGFYALVSVAGNLGASFSAYVAVNVAQIPVTQFPSWLLLISPLALVALFVLMRPINTRFRMPMLLIGGLVFVAGFHGGRIANEFEHERELEAAGM